MKPAADFGKQSMSFVNDSAGCITPLTRTRARAHGGMTLALGIGANAASSRWLRGAPKPSSSREER